MAHPPLLRLGTRKSTLALAQAEIVCGRLRAAFPGLEVALVPMTTSGDKNTDKSLADIGGKGLFTKELEEALLRKEIDAAVHSLKDMETHLPQGLLIAATLERADPRDAFVSRQASTLMELKKGARVGTSSPRRAAELKILRPDLVIIPLRGNVTTRLAKLDKGEADATLLALAGLTRIGMEKEVSEVLDTERFIPAAGQGTLALECREEDSDIRKMLGALDHAPTHSATIAERKVLAVLGGSCRTPIGAYARMENGIFKLDAILAKADGSSFLRTTQSGDINDAEAIGERAGNDLLARGGKELI